MRVAVALLLVFGVAAWIACFVAMFGDESPAARAADGALLFVLLGVLTALSFLVWPGRA